MKQSLSRFTADPHYVAVLAGALAFILIPRLIVAPISVIDWDESAYLLVAREVLHGIMPYEGAFDHKPAGLYFLVAAFLAIFGEGVTAIRALSLVAVLATALMLVALSRRTHATGTLGSFMVVSLYGLLTIPNGGLAGNTEISLNLFMVLAIFMAVLGRLDSRVSAPFGVACGLSLGFGFQINYLAGFLILGFAFYYLTTMSRANVTLSSQLKRLAANASIVLVSFLVAQLIVLSPVVVFGDIEQYFRLQVRFLSGYGENPSTEDFIRRVLEQVRVYAPLLVLAAVIAAWVTLKRLREFRSARIGWQDATVAVAWAGYTAFALIAACASRRIFDHYFLMLVPGLVMMAVWVVQLTPAAGGVRAFIAMWMLGIGMLGTAWSGNVLVAGLRASMNIIRGEPADDIARVSQRIRDELADGDTIYVYDTDHIHYLLTGAGLPTRYPFPYHHLSDVHAARLGFRSVDEMASILARAPKFVIAGSDPHDSAYGEASLLLAESLNRCYSKTGMTYVRKGTKVVVYERTGC